MKSDYNAREKRGERCRRIMLYIHGGAYFFGSVDEHRYQLQRHARKLQARVFAPRYRLAPQFPFPCGLLDCLAAYLYVLTIHDPSEIILAGDSAGGGMILSILCMIRDQHLPMPAGAVLISPWVDLTHSFPSLSRTDKLDYIPAHGFMQKPSRSWPPVNLDDVQDILGSVRPVASKSSHVGDSSKSQCTNIAALDTLSQSLADPLQLQVDGQTVIVKDQVQLYTTNKLITHPLVSPILQPTLGGLCPLLIMVGGGEVLRDEQVYAAHKAANPSVYPLPSLYRSTYDPEDKLLHKYKPTPVQLQVWEDLCHVTPTLSFTRPAKYMYRAVAQFSAWALSRAQKRAILITRDIGTSSSESSDSEDAENVPSQKYGSYLLGGHIGKAGDPLPRFQNHMIRHQVDRHGNTLALSPVDELEAMSMSTELIGTVKEGPIQRWTHAKQEWDKRYSRHRQEVHKLRIKAHEASLSRQLAWPEGENPPPSALIRRKDDDDMLMEKHRSKKSFGLGLWSNWGSKHDGRKIEEDAKSPPADNTNSHTQAASHDRSRPNISGSASLTSESSSKMAARRRSARRATVSVHDEGQLNDTEPLISIPAVNATSTNGAVATAAQ